MSSDSKKASIAPVDIVVGRALQTRYANLSRRAFLSSLTRKVFGLAGIGLAPQVFPYFVPNARAAGMTCGLHGYDCDSATPCSGGSVGASWVQCCARPTCPATYKCCTYTDFCGTRASNWGTGCHGNYIQGAPAWCGNAPGQFICTSTVCGTHIYGALSSCERDCTGNSCAF